ncbi:MAG: NusG domain II-containing protein [Halanaerobiales bacterium]
MRRLWNFITIYDKVLIVSLLLLSVIAIFAPVGFLLGGGRDTGQEKVIVIQQADNNQQRIPNNSTYQEEPLYIEVNGPLGTSIIEAHNGKVRLKEAPPEDPEKICEKTGWIDQPGPMIICVPNQVSIWIEQKDSDLDGVSY